MNHPTKPTTLLCTVGTSLLGSNLRNFDQSTYTARLSLNEAELLKQAGIPPGSTRLCKVLNEIHACMRRSAWVELAELLVEFPVQARILGAEINSIAAMIDKNILADPPSRLVLLVSDTKAGGDTGTVLRQYFLSRNNPCRFSQVLVLIIEGLQDQIPRRFQQEGLPNLVRVLADQTRQWSPSHVAINATGGYKAQIALAVAFGQVMGTPVYYKHELFNEIISFPRVPFTMDLSMVEKNIGFWARISQPGSVFTYDELKSFARPGSATWEAMLPLMETIEQDNKALYALSSLGLIYWEAFLTRHPDLTIRPIKAENRRGCRFRDDHYPIGFKTWVEDIYLQNDFVTGCHSLAYSGQAAIKPGFGVEGEKIIGGYVDKNGFSARVEVMTTCTNDLERAWVVRRLNGEG
ncbi:putative CRISPR-associated protein [Desulfoplanes sp. PS50]